MRRVLIAVCVMVATARADDAKAVDAAITGLFDTTGEIGGSADWYDRLAGVDVGAPSGASSISSTDLVDCGMTGPPLPGALTWKLGAITRAIDAKRGFAWFQAPLDVGILCAFASFNPPAAGDSLRASGILVRDKAQWRVVALSLSRPLPDAKLYKGTQRALASGEPGLDDSVASAAAAAWFTKGGFARAKADGAVASGTDPREYATGPAAAQLAAAWDKLGLHADSIEAATFANGSIAMIHAEVPLPVRGAKRAVPMTLYAIATLDNNAWRWVSLQFTSPVATPPQATQADQTGIECPNGKC